MNGAPSRDLARNLSLALSSSELAERRQALRHLLRYPLVSRARDETVFVLIVRHRRWLTRWFSKHVRWHLEVDNASGFARLHKIPAKGDTAKAWGESSRAFRPARLGSNKPPFTRRRYVLLCLALAALDGCTAQTTLASLAELVVARSEHDAQIETFDSDVYGERRAFVDALRWLTDAGVLTLRDGDADRYASSGAADALYDLDDRLLGQLISAPNPPALSADRAQLLHEHYADTDEGQRQRARHSVLRRLLDDPVVYLDDLTQAQRDWLDPSRSFVYKILSEDVGMVVERRMEGLAAIDPDGSVTDILFPDGASTVKHAALLLGEHLVAQVRAAPECAAGDPPGQIKSMSNEEVTLVVRDLIDTYAERCGWKKDYVDGESGEKMSGARRLANDALALLEGFGLVRRVADGWLPRPALARFAPLPPGSLPPETNAAEWGSK